MSRRSLLRILSAAVRLLLSTVAIAACLVLSAPAWGETDEPVASSTPEVSGIAESRSRIQEGKYDEALAILRPLARGREVDAGVLFQIGLAATGASQQPGLADDQRKALLDEAIGAFRTMLIDRPGLVRVRLELARALFLKGENDLSRRHFEQVLAGNPPAPVLANVRRFLAEIRARRRWTLHTGFALAPDTNIGGTSDERIIHIDIGGQRLPFRRDAEDLTTSGIGVSVWTGGEYQYPLGDGVRLRAGANLSRRDYAGSRFDQTFVSGHAGPRWLMGRNTEASVLASVHGAARSRFVLVLRTAVIGWIGRSVLIVTAVAGLRVVRASVAISVPGRRGAILGRTIVRRFRKPVVGLLGADAIPGFSLWRQHEARVAQQAVGDQL